MIREKIRASDYGFAETASSEAFAAAMVACQVYAPACADAGGCIADGECFETHHHGFAARLIETMAAEESRPSVKGGLMRAAALLRAEIDAEPETAP